MSETERKERVERVFNRDGIKEMFEEGAIWAMKTEAGEVRLNRIDIQLVPGTYEVKPGDTLQLIGFTNKFKKDPETGEVNPKKPDFNIKVKTGGGGGGSYGGGRNSGGY